MGCCAEARRIQGPFPERFGHLGSTQELLSKLVDQQLNFWCDVTATNSLTKRQGMQQLRPAGGPDATGRPIGLLERGSASSKRHPKRGRVPFSACTTRIFDAASAKSDREGHCRHRPHSPAMAPARSTPSPWDPPD